MLSKHKQIELEVDDLVSELKEKHGTKNTIPQLRLWARMINCGNHDRAQMILPVSQQLLESSQRNQN